ISKRWIWKVQDDSLAGRHRSPPVGSSGGLGWRGSSEASLPPGLKGLEFLDLAGTRISDAGLVHLERLKSLRRLLIRSTRVRKAGVERLRRASPNLDVDDPVPVSRKR